MNDVSKILK